MGPEQCSREDVSVTACHRPPVSARQFGQAASVIACPFACVRHFFYLRSFFYLPSVIFFPIRVCRYCFFFFLIFTPAVLVLADVYHNCVHVFLQFYSSSSFSFGQLASPLPLSLCFRAKAFKLAISELSFFYFLSHCSPLLFFFVLDTLHLQIFGFCSLPSLVPCHYLIVCICSLV